jgi:hypothetical protein
MEVNLFKIKLNESAGAPYLANYSVLVIWDTDTNNFKDVAGNSAIQLLDNNDDPISLQTSGPDLSGISTTVTNFGYKFCDGTTLNTFASVLNTFPYAVRSQAPGHFECTAVVCDLTLDPDSTLITDSTGEGQADGEFTVLATSTAGGVIYSLEPITKGGAQASGTFSGLLAGIYTVYIQDAQGCQITTQVEIKEGQSYGVKYRAEYQCIAEGKEDWTGRIDILERGFTGSLTEVNTGKEPITISYTGEGEGKFKTTISSTATIQLDSDTNFKFVELFIGDERKYKVIFYKDYGSGFEIKWQGFILPTEYEEPYTDPGYIVTVTATDGLADLKDQDFGNLSGNLSLIKVIARCLRNTDLNLNIRSAISRFELNHDTDPEDDPLEQTFVDASIYTDKTCDEVLNYVLIPFGARLFQSKNVWWIISIEDTPFTFSYRQFSPIGIYQSNSTYDPRIYSKGATETQRIVWLNQSGKLMVRPGYRDVIIDYNAGLVNNIFFTGRFEPADIVGSFFKGWSLDISGASGATSGIENVSNGDSTGALFIDFQNAQVGGTAYLVSEQKVFAKSENDRIRFSFQYLIYAIRQLPYLRFDWRLKVGTAYLQPNGQWSSSSARHTIYANNFNQFETFEIETRLNTSLVINNTNMEISLGIYGNHPYDASSLAAFAALTTTSLSTGDQRISLDTIGAVNVLRYYRLEEGNDTTSSPDIIRPDDYGGSNQRVWRLQNTINFVSLVNQVNSFLIDNLKVEYFPDGLEPESPVYTGTINSSNKVDLPVNVFHGDLPESRNAIHIFKNYFRLSDGTPTELWSRSTVSESLPLLSILMADYIGQLPNGVKLQMGQYIGDVDLDFINCIIDTMDSDTIYAPMRLDIMDMSGIYNVETWEVLAGIDGEPPPDTAGYSLGYSLGYRS